MVKEILKRNYVRVSALIKNLICCIIKIKFLLYFNNKLFNYL